MSVMTLEFKDGASLSEIEEMAKKRYNTNDYWRQDINGVEWLIVESIEPDVDFSPFYAKTYWTITGGKKYELFMRIVATDADAMSQSRDKYDSLIDAIVESVELK